MKKIIIFAAAVCILTMGLFNYLKSPGNNLGDLETKAVTPKILKSQNNKVNEKSLDNFAKNDQIIISSPDKDKAKNSVVKKELYKADNKFSRKQLYTLYNDSKDSMKGASRSVTDFINDILGSK
ncbi:hypothetical protein [Lactococcus lactis]|uniref:hypothetical protein n=1 Tax=Lactococcus lactis TaxID=1358 RepID=UPI0021A44E2D|nr:hypothetical protein [Lactococcus lactis]MCT3132361.1 hypothetical protein [Lactococcus lactis]MDT2851035.1 hypothetical protein [Lactococcus lactis]